MSADIDALHAPTPSLTMARSLSQPVEELQKMDPFELFRSQMEAGSTEAKVDAMKRLGTVAFAIGSEATLTLLLPYLNNVATQQPPHEDELLLLLAKKLQTLVPTLIKVPTPLLPIYELLAEVEETVVRDEAVRGINHIAPYFKETPLLVSMSKRLVGADWFTPKVSAAGVMPKIYELSKDADLIPLYKELAGDETPMVRRGAAKHFGAFLNYVGYEDGKDTLLTVLQQLCADEQDSVRLLAVAALANVGSTYGTHPDWTSQHFLPLLRDGSTDMSWRVRHNVAKHFSEIASNLGIQGIESYGQEQKLVLSCYVLLLNDTEAEVRAAAVGHFARMVHWGGSANFQTHLQPLLPSLADDVVMEVRSKCALALMDSSEGGTLEDSLILSAFGPLVESFLQDEFHEVQLQVLTNLQKMAHLLTNMGGVVTLIINMSKATNWRVREAVSKLLPHLAEARGLDFFATVLLEPAWLILLLDPVANVRRACVAGVGFLTNVAGQEWMVKNVLPQHVRLYNNASSMYLVRITILNAHAETAVAAKSGALWHDCVLQILRGLNDKVANVRMVAARGLAKVVSDGDPAVVKAQIVPALEKRNIEETDEDCRQAYQIALGMVSASE